jgi:hypothetical protein
MRTKTPKGRLLFAHVEQDRDAAQRAAEDYRQDRRNRGAWTVRCSARTVRADGVDIPCVAVIVREKA